jgi:hypothetical protein
LLGVLSGIFEFWNRIRGIEEPEREYREIAEVPEGIFKSLMDIDPRWGKEAVRQQDTSVKVISPPGWTIAKREKTYISPFRPHLRNLYEIKEWERQNTQVIGYSFKIEHPKKGKIVYEIDNDGIINVISQ